MQLFNEGTVVRLRTGGNEMKVCSPLMLVKESGDIDLVSCCYEHKTRHVFGFYRADALIELRPTHLRQVM
ncbi:hypothetical protein [Pseudomonas syringae]|uniref:hypothetical protein n=1 Tax=Pseudomonas syringae TaxID=317 RepID=UPI000CDB6F0C|nr:hypothetical protein [Pseudomonas syringae]POP69570.1 hypothetical protein CXB35_12645 [Pseudomonas syringae]